MSSISIFNTLIEKFNLATLAKSEWTHLAHQIVAIWHIKNYGFNDAVCQLRSKIILLNNTHGTQNTESSGYHETLTIFWAKIIDAYIKRYETYSFEEITDSFIHSPYASKELPFEFYRKEEILSADYRAVYHEPTLKKLN